MRGRSERDDMEFLFERNICMKPIGGFFGNASLLPGMFDDDVLNVVEVALQVLTFDIPHNVSCTQHAQFAVLHAIQDAKRTRVDKYRETAKIAVAGLHWLPSADNARNSHNLNRAVREIYRLRD